MNLEANLQRCQAEQAEAADYLRGLGPDKRGAFQGATDWIMEEALIRAKLKAQPEQSCQSVKKL